MRAHILVESALTIKLLLMLMPDGDNNNVQEDGINKLSEEDLEEIKTTCSQLTDLREATFDNNVFDKLETYKERLITHLSVKSRTANLWLQYMQYVKVLRQHILAARTGDWNLSLVSLQKMLNLFAATGHLNYAK